MFLRKHGDPYIRQNKKNNDTNVMSSMITNTKIE